jgi:CheY-like chemotaxis protein/phosphoribosyl 1,2-cyclic phosphodiesterase
MRIRFWGTRGSLAKPGATTVRYGGNTSCVEVRAPDGTLIVLDCGTGAHELGQALLASGEHPIRGHLLITHTHWDHIQGFPFFAPLFVPGNEWEVYAPQGLGQRLEQTLAGQMEYTYFPVPLGQLRATIRYHELAEGAFEVGSVRVTTRFLNHPGLAMGYRLEAAGVVVVYATDHEPHSRHHGEAPGPDGEGVGPVHREDQRHVEFLAGADLVIHDAQYTLEEYPGKLTWGHTPAERAVDFARAAGARRLALFHHDPLRTDEAVDRLLASCRRRVAAGGGALDVFAAAEGQVIELGMRDARAAPPASPPPSGPAGPSPASMTVLVVDDDADILRLLILTLRSEGFRLLSATDGDTALEIARAERPDLLLLDWNMPGRDGLEVCRTLRADPDPHLRGVPVVLLTGQAQAEDTAAGFAAGATDYVTKPFKPAHVRARVHAWLMRSRAGTPEGV